MSTKICLAFLIVVWLGPSDMTAQQEDYIVISVNGLKLRNAPSTKGKVLATAPLGAKVTVLSSPEKEWEGYSWSNNSRYRGKAKIDTIGG